MEIVAYQPELCPALPVVIGNFDYTDYKKTLERIDRLLRDSRIEEFFIRCYLAQAERLGREQAEHEGIKYHPPSGKAVVLLEEHAAKSLRCNIIRSLEQLSYRRLSRRLADSPLLQWFCGINRMDAIRVPSKSSLDRYAKIVPEQIVRDTINDLTRAAAGKTDQGDHPLNLEAPISLDTLFLDTTCVKANIHFPVDWVLLRDASRTLLKAVQLIRRRGLKNRMADPSEFIRDVNRLCIQMTHSRRRKDGRKYRKQVLRLMKKLLKRIDKHAQRHRDLLADNWQETDLSEGQVHQILFRIDRIRDQLPAAINQAHERLIGERQVANKDKILSLYEPDLHVIVRGKEGSEVEFGNTFLLGEQEDGVIVDWKLIKDRAPSDTQLVRKSLQRFSRVAGDKMPGALVGDRGFDSPGNRQLSTKQHEIYNAICPKSPARMRERMQEARFVELQSRRSQTEGRIGIFKNAFLGRPMKSKGFDYREQNITWAVLAHNLWVIARLPQVNSDENRLTQAA